MLMDYLKASWEQLDFSLGSLCVKLLEEKYQKETVKGKVLEHIITTKEFDLKDSDPPLKMMVIQDNILWISNVLKLYRVL